MSIVSHKIRLYPKKEQKILINKSCEVQGFVYNWGLKTWGEQYKKGLKPTYFSLKKEFNAIKRVEFPFVMEVSKCCVEGGLSNLSSAFKMFFKKAGRYPKFKKLDKKNSFYLANDKFEVKDGFVKLAKIKKVKIAENLRFKGKILSATISRKSDKYYISITVDEQILPLAKTNKYIGLDVGLKDFVVTSSGYKFNNPYWLKKNEQKLKRLQRSLARMKRGSNNKERKKLKISKVFDKISNQRNDYQDKISTYLIRSNDEIAVEDLNIKGMLKNHKLAKQISNVGWNTFINKLTNKAKMYGRNIVKVDRWFPSTKLCGICGNLNNEMTLNVRNWTCKVCGTKHDRDVNASFNILRQAMPCKCGDRTTSVNIIKDIKQVDWLNHEIKYQVM